MLLAALSKKSYRLLEHSEVRSPCLVSSSMQLLRYVGDPYLLSGREARTTKYRVDSVSSDTWNRRLHGVPAPYCSDIELDDGSIGCSSNHKAHWVSKSPRLNKERCRSGQFPPSHPRGNDSRYSWIDPYLRTVTMSPDLLASVFLLCHARYRGHLSEALLTATFPGSLASAGIDHGQAFINNCNCWD